MKSKLSLLMLISLFLGACSEKLDQINPSLVKLYLFDKSAEKNVFCFEAKNLANNELLVFGVGSTTNNKFDTDGRLYLQRINAKGENVWNDFYLNQGGGFPSNVIQVSDNEFVLFWTNNKTFQAITIIVEDTQPKITSTTIKSITDFETTSIVYAIAHKKRYYILGTAIDNYTDNNKNKIYVSELDAQFAVIQNLSQQEYEPQAFGTLDNDDLNGLKRLGKYFFMGSTETMNYFVAPFKTQMALKEIGSTVPIYQDAKKWIVSMDYLADNKFFTLFTNPDNISQVHLEKQLDISQINLQYKQLTQSDSITGMDITSPLLVKCLSNKRTLLVGTTNQGQMRIQSFDQNNKPLKTSYLGQTYPYKITQILELNEGKTLAIVGTTMIKNSYQRIFLIQVPTEQFF